VSFHSDLIADAVWPADIRTALSIAGTQVYVGRRPAAVTHKDVEVLIQRDATQERTRGGFEKVKAHRYTLRIRTKTNAGGDGTGKSQQDTIDGHLRTLVDRYHGQRVLTATDVDPTSKPVHEGTMRVIFMTEE